MLFARKDKNLPNLPATDQTENSPDTTQNKPVKLPRLMGKQRLWLRNYTDINNPATFFNATESAKCSNYQCENEGSYGTIGKENFSKLQKHIDHWLDYHALSDTALKGKICNLMNAEDTKLFQDRDENGKLTILEHKIPALSIQQKSLDMALKVKGLYQDSSQSSNMPAFQINFNIAAGPEQAPVIEVKTQSDEDL